MLTTVVNEARVIQHAKDRYVAEAAAVGVPRDQIERFIVGGYVAQPHQLAFHAVCRQCDAEDGPELVGFGGARGPGKTHGGFAQVALDDCQRFDGLKFLFLRMVAKKARESAEDLRRSVLRGMAHIYRRQDGVFEFANGSRILLGHFNNESDIDQYLGIEYDGALIEEANTLSRSKHDAIAGSIRTSKPGWRPRRYMTFNPGGVGHQYMKKLFIEPYRQQAERGTRFVPGTARQNKFLNPGYNAWLESLSGSLGRMWRDGDWDAAGGQFFTSWSYDRHVIPVLPAVPPHWRVWLSMDYGYSHYTVVHLFAQDDDGHVYIVDEHAERRWLIQQHAQAVKAMLARNGVSLDRLSRFVAGHDCFATRHTGTTIADEWHEQLGVHLQRAKIDRINGAAQLLAYLGNVESQVEPRLHVTARCARLIACIPALLSDPARPDDVLKVDADENGDGGDDPYDCARYGLMEASTVGLDWSFV